MSLNRLIYYSMMVGGWAAFLGWLLAEFGFFRQGSLGGRLEVMLVSAIVGAAIGGGLNVVAGLSNAQWVQQLRRLVPGLIGGGLGGAAGGVIGDVLFAFLGLPRALGWMIMGLGIGVVEGIYERSPSKIRNGLIGGGIGGLLGGFLFDMIPRMISSGTGMSSRATGFVILGLCIGALVGLAQVVLKHAWLTVVDGYGTGRQLILSRPVTVLGRAEHIQLPFLGSMNQDLEPEHLRIIREPSGAFVAEDNNTKLKTSVNGQAIAGRVRLKDNDVIKLGTNFVRFNERQVKSAEAATAPTQGFTGTIKVAPPPPPIINRAVSAVNPPGAAAAAPKPPTAAPRPGSPPPTAAKPSTSTAAKPPLAPPPPRKGPGTIPPPPPPPKRTT
jgi:FHA domain